MTDEVYRQFLSITLTKCNMRELLISDCQIFITAFMKQYKAKCWHTKLYYGYITNII